MYSSSPEKRAITPFTLIRMGLAYALTREVVRGCQHGKNYCIHDDSMLRANYIKLINILSDTKFGLYRAFAQVFSMSAAISVAERYKLPVPENADPSRSSSSSKQIKSERLDDDMYAGS